MAGTSDRVSGSFGYLIIEGAAENPIPEKETIATAYLKVRLNLAGIYRGL
jgi:hypothetical protein